MSKRVILLALCVLMLAVASVMTSCDTVRRPTQSESASEEESHTSQDSSSFESQAQSETESESEPEGATESESESAAERDYFIAEVLCNSNLEASPYVGSANVISELEGVYYSSDIPGGRPEKDGTGNIWLEITPLKNYQVSKISIEGAYSSVESVEGDVYCICGVESDLTVSISAKMLPGASRDVFDSYGYGISDDGILSVTWSESESEPIRYVELRYTDSTGARVEYLNPSTGCAELFKMTENKVHTVYIRAIGYSEAGRRIEIKSCYMSEPRGIPFPRVELVTEDFVWPSADFVESPDGCWGAGLQNNFYENCSVTLYDKNNEIIYTSSTKAGKTDGARVKLRGNTSAVHASQERYPYKLKLDEKFDLLEPLIGRNDDGKSYADRDWLLLNYGADGYRVCGDAVADAVGTAWSPEYCYVALYLNGEYRGLYVLSEAVEEGSGQDESQWRVNVDEDGFVFECDAYWWNEDLYFSTPLTENTPMYFTFRYPESDEISSESPEYIYLRDYMIEFEEALLRNDDSYLDYIDLDSFVKWLLVADYLSISDGGGCNIFLYKKDSSDDTKIAMGPNWDFDSYMGDVDALATIRMSWDGAPYYFPYLLKKDSFQKRYEELFAETSGRLAIAVEDAFSRIDNEAHSRLLQCDNARFGTSTKSLYTEKQEFLSWLAEHIEWMNS